MFMKTNMPLLIIAVTILIGLFTVTSFATFQEIKQRKKKKIPKFLEQWKKVKDKLEK
jgi:hypothetical protein